MAILFGQKKATAIKINCWEFKKCGRQPGGHKEKELGTCPVTVHGDFDGAHEGKNGGRACWAIAGSLCGGKIQGTYAQKLLNCWRCEFMNLVKRQEEPAEFGFSATRLGIEKVLEKTRHKLVQQALGPEHNIQRGVSNDGKNELLGTQEVRSPARWTQGQ